MNDALKKTPDSTPPPPLANRAPPKAAPVSGAKTASALKGPTAGAPEGTDKVLTAGERDRLRGLMAAATYRCYNVNAGIEGGNTLAVKFELKFKRDGYLMEEPKLVTPGSGPKFDDAVNNARRALIACQPYSTLPQELYDNGWAWSTFEFIPPK